MVRTAPGVFVQLVERAYVKHVNNAGNDTHRIILGDVLVYPLRKKDYLFGGIVAIMYLCYICFIMV